MTKVNIFKCEFRCHANHYRHTTRFDLCVAIVSFLSALAFSIKVHSE
jgi:hypothetical protein